MTRLQLVKEIGVKAEVATAVADKVFKAFMATVTEVLASGQALRILNFGSFSTSKRAARRGVNPQTGKKIDIAAATVAKFKVGKGLKLAVNG